MTPVVAPLDYRAEMARLMRLTVDDQARRGTWRYRAVRPQDIPARYSSGQIVEVDCSDYCRTIARLAGVPDDPAGTAWEPYGNSSSIWAHLHTALPITAAEVGDIFVFGHFTGELHACMVHDVTNPHDPDVANMGTSGQPVFRKLSQEIAGHPGATVTLCKIRLPAAPVVPPAVAKLRARTGFYSWVAWRLGEQDWRHYGPANKTVRPNVPKVVPLAWWKRYAVFLANRKKPNAATSRP